MSVPEQGDLLSPTSSIFVTKICDKACHKALARDSPEGTSNYKASHKALARDSPEGTSKHECQIAAGADAAGLL